MSSLAVVQKSYLRPGSKSLYQLIVQKLEDEDKLTLAEAKEIWLHQVARHVIKGVPHRATWYDDEAGVGRESLIPMSREEVTERVLMWLTSTMGVLVIRGYLNVIPMVEVKQMGLDA